MTITKARYGGSMNTFHEINIFTSRGDFKSALILLKNRTESVARKILKKAGYSVPDLYGRSFWIYAQNTIMQAARNLSSGYMKAENYGVNPSQEHHVCSSDTSSMPDSREAAEPASQYHEKETAENCTPAVVLSTGCMAQLFAGLNRSKIPSACAEPSIRFCRHLPTSVLRGITGPGGISWPVVFICDPGVADFTEYLMPPPVCSDQGPPG